MDDEQLPLIPLDLCELILDIAAYDRVGTYVRSCILPAGHDGTCVATWTRTGAAPTMTAFVSGRWL